MYRCIEIPICTSNNTIQFDKIYDFSNQKDEITINKIQADKISHNKYLINL